MNQSVFSVDMKMADIVLANSRLLYVLPLFGIELGFGEKTLAQICAERELSAPLVLLVCNLYTFDDYTAPSADLKQIPIEGIVGYLLTSHEDYLKVRLPHIIDGVLSLAHDNHMPSENMLAAFCEKYKQEIIAHYRYEEEVVFPYIHSLLRGERPDYKIGEYESNHGDIDAALEDLKNIIVKYLPETCTIARSRPVLEELFNFEHDLRKHNQLEDRVLIPLVENLDNEGVAAVEGMSGREIEVLALLARGLSNKEIADKLHISTHTVISHRKNIIRKTGIKTAQGLTLYAFLNNLITPGDLR